MGAIDKFLGSLNLNGNDSADEYYDDYDDNDDDARKNVKSNDDGRASKFSKVTSIGKKKTMVNNQPYEINVIKPTSIDDAHSITDSIMENKAVLLNLTGVDREMATRVLDFTNGTVYALDGGTQMVTETIYLIVPHGVDISGSLDQNDDDE